MAKYKDLDLRSAPFVVCLYKDGEQIYSNFSNSYTQKQFAQKWRSQGFEVDEFKAPESDMRPMTDSEKFWDMVKITAIGIAAAFVVGFVF